MHFWLGYRPTPQFFDLVGLGKDRYPVRLSWTILKGSRVPGFLLSTSALCLALATGALAQEVGEPAPAGEGLPLFRSAGSVAVLALATEDWLPVPTDAHDMLGVYQYLPPFATEDTRGQIFQVLGAENDWPVADAHGRFVGVPWTVGCGCADEGWDQPGWVPAGDTVVFLLQKTRSRVPWKGPPVYDVLGWHQPYPAADFIPYWRTSRVWNPDWLSPTEFYGMVQALPTEAGFQLDPEASFAGLMEWLSQHPERRGAFPIPSILSEWEAFLGAGPTRSPHGWPKAASLPMSGR